MKAKYLDIFTDFGFKKIFGEEANKLILIDFFNALLPDISPIRDLTFKNTEQQGININDRKAVFDIYCENDKGEKFIVEMQKTKQDFFKERTLYYATFPIREQAEKGYWDFNLKAVYCVALIDFTFNDQLEKKKRNDVIYDIRLRDKSGNTFYDKLTFVYLEMPNFKKTELELETRLDKWLYFIKNLENFQSIPGIFKDEVVFLDALQKAELAKFDESQMYSYEASLKGYRDSINQLNTAKREGRSEGRMEGNVEATYKIAKAMIVRGLPNDLISETTGLIIEEIEKL